jgi:sucrose-6-phosphate hydrolase SacC (GH32 family)
MRPYCKIQRIKLTVILDNSSLELFADGGLTCMTDIFFPEQPFNEWRTEANKTFLIRYKSASSSQYGPLRKKILFPLNS